MRRPHLPAPLACALLLVPWLPALPRGEARGEDVPVPTATDWRLLDGVDEGGREPFRPSAAFRRYLLRADAPPPSPRDLVKGAGGREAAWRAVVADAQGRVDPGEAAWATATLQAPSDGVWLAAIQGAAALFVNGTPVCGDVYGHGIVRTPVALRRGPSTLFAQGFRGAFSVAFTAPPAPLFVAPEDATLPDLVRSATARPHAAVLVVNARPSAVRGVTLDARVTAGAATATGGVRLRHLPPCSATKVPLVLGALAVPADAREASLDVTLADCDGALGRRSFPLVLRAADEPRRVTFVSALDGSVQEYALRPPVGVCPPDAPLRLVLSLHGASVDALAQVQAYSARPDFVVVAPTNRRPFGFDWQDWGRQDAYEALAHALAATGIDRRRVSLTGHSMGGHGTWHLAANDPDGFGAVAPSAAWVSFATYAGSAPTGPLALLWRAADAASDALALVDNLAGLPIRQLHGADDDNVPLSEARRMEDALRSKARDYVLEVIEGQGHWWDGDAAPGVDCVDWTPFFETFRRHEVPAAPEHVAFTSVDPAVDATHFWVTVQQALQIGEPLKVGAVRAGDGVEVTTANVRRMALAPPPAWAVARVRVDGQPLPWPEGAARLGLACSDGTWRTVHPAVPPRERSPARSGPFKRLFDRRFVLVYGTAGDEDEDRRALERARFDAERWRYRANGTAEVLTDLDFLDLRSQQAGRNVVLYGNATTNRAWAQVLSPCGPVHLSAGQAVVGQRRFEGDDLGAFFVQPRADDPQALAGAVAWTGSKGERLTVLSLYFASGVGYPDYVLFGPEVLERGDAGVRAAGFFDVTWQVAD